MKVLIVDDNAALKAATVRLIRTWGGQVESADTATQAKAMLRTNHYDVILLGVRLPTASGLWFLRNTSIPPETQVVAMASCAPRSMLRELKALGAVDFLQKPFDAQNLWYALETCMAKRHCAAPPLECFRQAYAAGGA